VDAGNDGLGGGFSGRKNATEYGPRISLYGRNRDEETSLHFREMEKKKLLKDRWKGKKF